MYRNYIKFANLMHFVLCIEITAFRSKITGEECHLDAVGVPLDQERGTSTGVVLSEELLRQLLLQASVHPDLHRVGADVGVELHDRGHPGAGRQRQLREDLEESLTCLNGSGLWGVIDRSMLHQSKCSLLRMPPRYGGSR